MVLYAETTLHRASKHLHDIGRPRRSGAMFLFADDLDRLAPPILPRSGKISLLKIRGGGDHSTGGTTSLRKFRTRCSVIMSVSWVFFASASPERLTTRISSPSMVSAA